MAYAEIIDTRIRVDTSWNEKELIKQVPGARWSTQDKCWYLQLQWASCVILQGVFKADLSIGNDLMKWGWEKRKHINRLLEMRAWTEPFGWLAQDSRLYPFQAVGARFLRRVGELGAILGDEMGTGKTIQVLASLNEMSLDDALPALVVCPNSVKTNWAKEALKWLPSCTPYVITGGPAQRKKIIQTAAMDPKALIIANYEALRALTRLAPYGSTRLKKCRVCDPKAGEEAVTTTRCQVHPRELNNIKFRTIVIDEAHKIKDPQSQQTRAVWAVAHGAHVVNCWGLTGTILANDPGDLWAVLHAIAPKEFPTKTGYVDRFCLQTWNAFGGLSIVGLNPANKEEFYKIFDPRWRRMPKDLVLDQLPPKIRTTRWVELSTAQRKMYKQFKDGLAANTEGGVLVAPDGMIARMRQMQIASATPRVDGYEANGTTPIVSLHDPSSKLDELEDVLEELGPKPVVICCESYKLLALAEKRLVKLKRSYGVIAGPVSEYERDLALRKFQDNELQTLLFTIQAGGTGLTMTAADTIIFLQRSWSMINNKQAEDRVHRIGSEIHKSIHVIDIVARDTVEEGQIASLTEKFMRLQEIARDRATIMAAGGRVDELDAEEALILGSEL